MSETVKITGLQCFPVKSLAGINLTETTLTPQGLLWDRHWMICKPDGVMLTQRTHPQMATITTSLATSNQLATLTLHHKKKGSVTVHSDNFSSGKRADVTIWKDSVPSRVAPAAINTWLSHLLGEDCRLVTCERLQKRQQANPNRFKVETTNFVDAGPLLIVNAASLQQLNTHLKANNRCTVSMNRFRANIVIEGLPAFHEHAYKGLYRQNQYIELIDACSRCVIITINPDTGKIQEKGEPFKTLMSINTLPDQPKTPAFGVNSVFRSNHETTISLGQQWEIY